MKITMILLLFLQGHALFAQSQRLVVWLKNGEKVYFELDESPKTTFDSDNLVITTNTIVVHYPLGEIQRYTYELQSSGIEIASNTKFSRILQKDGSLIFENFKAGTPIHLYATDGKLLKELTADGRQNTTVSLDKYPAGVYIVKANQVTYKIMKK